jgi:hypothetical protein
MISRASRRLSDVRQNEGNLAGDLQDDVRRKTVSVQRFATAFAYRRRQTLLQEGHTLQLVAVLETLAFAGASDRGHRITF